MRFISLNLLPWVSAGLALAIAIVLFTIWRRRRAIRALAASGGLVSNASPSRRVVRDVALVAACILAGVAALRPITGTILTEHRLPAKNLVIVLDVSKSMAAADAGGLSRLEAAKLHARELMNARAGDRIGLITFAGEAFVECPVTRSRTTLESRLDLVKPGMLPSDGTDLGAALRRARDLLGENPPKGSSILLFSDGDNVMGDPLKELEELRKRNLPVHTLTFGTPGVPAPLPAGLSKDANAASTADPKCMEEIAKSTDGTAFIGDPANLDGTIARMNPTLDAVNVGGNDIAREFRERPVDVYVWPLGVALACLMLRFFLPLRTRQWHPLATAVITLMILAPSLRAAEPESLSEKQGVAISESPAHGRAMKSDSLRTLTHHGHGGSESATPWIPSDRLPISQTVSESKQPTAYETALEAARAADKPLVVVFTGSDWSDTSIRFEREILSHQTYRDWAQRSVIVLPVDLPRRTIPEETRRQGRELLKQLNVTTYPTAVFINAKDGKEMGRLGHDPAGPAAWLIRANAILRGDSTVSDSDKGPLKLSDTTRAWLDDATVPFGERSARYYNQALLLEAANPKLALSDKKRIELLDSLLSSATELAGNDTRLSFPPRLKLATLQHLRGLVPDMKKPANPVRQLEAAQAAYASAASVAPANDEDLSHNLAALTRDLDKARKTLACYEAYQKAARLAGLGNAIEGTFHRNLENWVTTGQPINDRRIEEATAAIDDLVIKADAADFPNKENFRKAAAEIRNCPAPHGTRDLKASAESFKKTYDLLVPPSAQQQQKQKSDDPSDDEGEGEGDQDQDDPQQSKEPDKQDPSQDRALSEQEGDAALRRAAEKDGAMRDQQLKELGRNRKSVPPGQDR